jgi:hypothetical protein
MAVLAIFKPEGWIDISKVILIGIILVIWLRHDRLM